MCTQVGLLTLFTCEKSRVSLTYQEEPRREKGYPVSTAAATPFNQPTLAIWAFEAKDRWVLGCGWGADIPGVKNQELCSAPDPGCKAVAGLPKNACTASTTLLRSIITRDVLKPKMNGDNSQNTCAVTAVIDRFAWPGNGPP